MKNFYHYTSESALHGIFHGHPGQNYPVYKNYDLSNTTSNSMPDKAQALEALSTGKCRGVDGKYIRGLWPSQRFCPVFSPSHPYISCPVIEGLTEPFPHIWNTNKEIPGEFDRLLDNICRYRYNKLRCQKNKLVLLNVQSSDNDEIYVADWALARNHFETPDSIMKASQYYLNSLIPLSEYTDKANYICPIVVCFNPIPVNRISISLKMDVGFASTPIKIRNDLSSLLTLHNLTINPAQVEHRPNIIRGVRKNYHQTL
ncbi:MAG: hypothetical protein ABTQ34_02810 [Bdellovibrionales bacterium]